MPPSSRRRKTLPTSLSKCCAKIRTLGSSMALFSVVIVDRQIDHAVGPERRAAGERPALDPRVGDENLLHVLELRADQTCARERERRLRIGVALDVVQIHAAVGRELRMHDRGLKPARLEARDGPAAERLRRQHAVMDEAHAARELGDERIAVGREREVARAREPFGNRHEAHAEQIARRALALRLAVRRARARHPRVEHERVGRRRRGSNRGRRRTFAAPLYEDEQQRQRQPSKCGSAHAFLPLPRSAALQTRYFQGPRAIMCCAQSTSRSCGTRLSSQRRLRSVIVERKTMAARLVKPEITRLSPAAKAGRIRRRPRTPVVP